MKKVIIIDSDGGNMTVQATVNITTRIMGGEEYDTGDRTSFRNQVAAQIARLLDQYEQESREMMERTAECPNP